MVQSGGNALDNKVIDSDGMHGWRQSFEEERQVIQGLLLDRALRDKKSAGRMNIVFVIIIVVILKGIFGFKQYMQILVDKRDNLLVIASAVMLLVAIVLVYQLGKNVYISLKDKPEDEYIKAIRNEVFTVLDVEIVRELQSHDGIDGVDGHYVKVKDMQGNICEKDYEIKFVNSYNGKDAVLVKVTPLNWKKARELVFPKKSSSEATWEKGLKLYQKYMK